MKKLKVFIICSGLGRINRGYESFFRGCFDALSADPSLDMTLFKGNGENHTKESSLWNIPRDGRLAKLLGQAVGRSGYFIEQLTFFMALLPHVFLKKPKVVYVSDVVLANFMRLLKKSINCSYEVLYCNGGPTRPDFLFRWDHIQQVSPQYMEEALKTGFSRDRQTLLPHGVSIPKMLAPLDASSKRQLRAQLGLPQNRTVLLSVGAINRGRKRMHYVIREVARLQKPRPFLLLLGQRESDTQDIVDLGNSLLSKEGFSTRTVAKDEVKNYYKAADLFALASLDEGFGLVYVEAMSYGLPCLVHDYETSRFVLGEMGYYGDLTQKGGLAKLICGLTARDFNLEVAAARHAYAYDRFSWDRLKPKYVELFRRCAKQGRGHPCV